MLKRLWIAVFLAGLLLAPPLQASELSDANTFFDWAEGTYSQYFAPAGAQTIPMGGYLIRQYAGTGNLLGAKDGRLYLYGDQFGGLVDLGTVVFWLNYIENLAPQANTRPSLTGHWLGTGGSTPYPACTGSIDIELVEEGTLLSGSGAINGPCESGSGNIEGTTNGLELEMGMAFDDTTVIYYSGTISEDGRTLSGSYSWPELNDFGTWILRKQ